MAFETVVVEFEGGNGSRLAGRLEMPGGTPLGYAVFAHCFTCSKDYKAIKWISQTLAGAGIASLRFDFTGLGESAGEFTETSFSSNLRDLVAAAAFLREHYAAPALLVGHSLGGAAVISVAPRIPEVRAVATISAPSDVQHVREMLLAQIPDLESRGEAEVRIVGRSFRVGRELVEDLEAHCIQDALEKMQRPLLIVHSLDDALLSFEHARRLLTMGREPKSLVTLQGADHLLSREADARNVGDILAAWAKTYLDIPPEAELPSLGHGEVMVAGGPSGYRQTIVAGRHELLADEPRAMGGMDSGPTPYQLLSASLGACTSMTLRMYADRKGWPLTGVRVLLRHSRIHAADCADCESKDGLLDHIDRQIELQGELTEGQRQRLLEIADKCPVHRTLKSEIHITTGLSETVRHEVS